MRRIVKRINEELAAHYTQGECNAIARILLTELLPFSTTEYILKDEVTLTPEQEQLLTQALERAKRKEPVQYILGYSDFCGLRFIVNSAVLIPRPETSELVEWIASCESNAASILDIGTGSGCIAISLAHKLPSCKLHAWDISSEALSVAQENSTSNGCKVIFKQRDILTYEPAEERYDVIVSNPPYIKEIEKQQMDDNVLLWEPHLALFVPDDNPLLFYRTIALKGFEMLTPGGRIYFEINRAHAADTIAMLQECGYHNITLRKDFADNDRMIRAEKA